MNEPEFKSAAFFLAEHTPRHLNQPTTPPIHWELEGDMLRVLLADGRTFRAPLADLHYPAWEPEKVVHIPTKTELSSQHQKEHPDAIPPAYTRPGKHVSKPIQVESSYLPPSHPVEKVANKK